MSQDAAEFYALDRDDEQCPECGEGLEFCHCIENDEAWWERASDEAGAILENEEKKQP